ncbi:MAG: hypothetical protein KAQ87_01385 [Candidatus Pacebacteria bacterium]|nr:hypothetical protein [Candidatus Paceibacterota bacterium]
MSLSKQIKDRLIKILWNGKSVPNELFELSQYFRNYGPIEFEFKQEDGKVIAISKNFNHGSIVTSGKDTEELEENIKDAILTSFDVPSSYTKEAGIHKLDKEKSSVFA